MQVYISKHLRDIISRKEARKRVNALKKTWVRNGDSKFKRATILPISWRAKLPGGIDGIILTAVKREDGTVKPVILDYIIKGASEVHQQHFCICTPKKDVKPGDVEMSLPPRYRKALIME